MNLYYDQSGFEIQPLSPLFLREDLGEFFKLKHLKTTFSLVYQNQLYVVLIKGIQTK